MIPQSEYKKRRKKLSKKLKNNSIAILFSATKKIRSNDTEYPYRQNSNFYYLSGFDEDSSALMITKQNNKTTSTLFVAKKDKKDELWNGKRVGVQKAKKMYLFDEVFCIDEFEKILKEKVTHKQHLYYDFALDYSKVKILKRYTKSIQNHKNIAPLIQKLRLIKSKNEIKLIKQSVKIAKKAHKKIAKMDKKGLFEYHLHAKLEYEFKKMGACCEAYTSIVASGNNANTLHYIKNNKRLKKGDLILIDAGCEYQHYASDITRTICIDDDWTKPQKEIYKLVYKTQQKIISMVRDGIKRSELQNEAINLLTKGMKKLGILKGSVKKLIKKEIYKKYYPHGIGHHLGLDVHDECLYKDKNGNEIPLKKGVVLTIEPGIYLPKDDKNIPKKYRGIGIRIEDDILVSKDGCKVL